MQTAKQLLAQKNDPQVLSISPNAMVIEAVKKMAEAGVGALIVLEDEKRLVGIFSERDYARKGIVQGKKSQKTPVSALMTAKVFTVLPSATIQECMEIMSEKRIRHLPVVSKQGNIAGVLSIGDLVNSILLEQQAKIRHLERYMRGI